MQVEFQATDRDYKNFIKTYYFKKDGVRRAFGIIILSMIIASFRQDGWRHDPPGFILMTAIIAACVFVIMVLAPYLYSRIRTHRTLQKRRLTAPLTFSIEERGISIISEEKNVFFRWESLRRAEIVDGYLFVLSFRNGFFIVPAREFYSENYLRGFLRLLQERIIEARKHSRERKIHNLYHWAWVGLLPNFGVIAGLILLDKGIYYKDRKLIVLSIACILFTVVFWVVMFSWVF